jgi:UDP-N-acetylmuramoylalanine--D-glutamate ligase
MQNPELRGESFLIIGYGREGRSVREFLARRVPGARIAIADRNPVPAHELPEKGVAVFTGEDYLSACSQDFSTIIRSPGVSIRDIQPHLLPSAHLTSATNIFFAECPGKIVGVTGTKGKSTTSALTAAILSRGFADVRLVGNIGVPMLNFLEGATSETIFVVELSSYQLEDLRRSPHIAILLNIVPEHLDYHGGFEAYRNAKFSIARHQSRQDILICNDSFPALSGNIGVGQATRFIFREGDDSAAFVKVRSGSVIVEQELRTEWIANLGELPLLGPGNLQNVLAAVTCGCVLGLSPEVIRAGVLSFKPLEHRLEFVAERGGVRFYNDSLSTIPEALAHALVALGADVESVIAGGFDRGVDMGPVGAPLAASNVRNLILFPSTGEKIWQAAIAAAPHRVYKRVDVQTMDEAVEAAYHLTSPGKICVMSPAASSFSVFRDYRERGERFKEAVMRIASLS